MPWKSAQELLPERRYNELFLSFTIESKKESAQELLPERRYNKLSPVFDHVNGYGRHRSFCLKGVTTFGMCHDCIHFSWSAQELLPERRYNVKRRKKGEG
mgnify:CR=1 FL=1